MKVMVIYESAYGNTEQIARAIASTLGTPDDVEVIRAGSVDPENLRGYEMVVIGAPTYGGRPMPPVQEFLNKIPENVIKGVKIAAFDTRIPTKIVGIFGYAAGKIANNLKRKGAIPVMAPEGFFVKGSKGPLKEGELERAAAWGRSVAEAQKAMAAIK